MPSSVLRFHRTDDASAFVVIRAEQNGKASTDLGLVGTDGAYPFVGTLSKQTLSQLKAKNNTDPDSEWAEIVAAIFIPESDKKSISSVKDIEVAATVDDQEIKLQIRKNIAGITQRLGTVTLTRNDEEAIGLFEWTAEAASSSENARLGMQKLQSRIVSQQQSLDALSQQLDGLIKTKKEHEEVLLSKFAEVLNAKKLKIRDQQRLLKQANIEPHAAGARRAPEPQTLKQASRSRTGKRKAESAPEDIPSDEASASSVQDEVEMERKYADEETPPASDDTATDGSDDNAEDVAAAAPAPSTRAHDRDEQLITKALPHGRPKTTEKASVAKTTNAEEDDETDDDEL